MGERVKGALGENSTIRVVCGVMEEELKHHALTLTEVVEKFRKWSEKVSHGKTNMATKPETSTIAESLKILET